MTKTKAPAPADARVMIRDAPVAWINVAHASDATLQKSLVTAALEHGFSHIVLPEQGREALSGLGRFQALGRIRNGSGPGDAVVGPDGALGRWVTLRSKKDEEALSALAGEIEFAVVSATDWKIIPLENLIADFQPTRSRLLAEVRSAEEAAVMLSTLEVGTDGVVLSAEDPQDIVDLGKLLAEMSEQRFSLHEAVVTSVSDAGTGDRVCIDTCSLMRPGEGMLVGGSAEGLFLVHSESLESPYVNARPFRVNAGAVYAYVMGRDGRTHYLSELTAGLPLLAVDHTGRARPVTVGRAKVETRPLLLLKARVGEGKEAREFGVVLQNAETIRLVTPGGGALSIVEAKPGDRILATRGAAARHFGRAIRETILEK